MPSHCSACSRAASRFLSAASSSPSRLLSESVISLWAAQMASLGAGCQAPHSKEVGIARGAIRADQEWCHTQKIQTSCLAGLLDFMNAMFQACSLESLSSTSRALLLQKLQLIILGGKPAEALLSLSALNINRSPSQDLPLPSPSLHLKGGRYRHSARSIALPGLSGCPAPHIKTSMKGEHCRTRGLTTSCAAHVTSTSCLFAI